MTFYLVLAKLLWKQAVKRELLEKHLQRPKRTKEVGCWRPEKFPRFSNTKVDTYIIHIM